jgi:hypothetical protein
MREEQPLWKRVGWMIAIWATSVAAMLVVAGAIRLILKP